MRDLEREAERLGLRVVSAEQVEAWQADAATLRRIRWSEPPNELHDVRVVSPPRAWLRWTLVALAGAIAVLLAVAVVDYVLDRWPALGTFTLGVAAGIIATVLWIAPADADSRRGP